MSKVVCVVLLMFCFCCGRANGQNFSFERRDSNSDGASVSTEVNVFLSAWDDDMLSGDVLAATASTASYSYTDPVSGYTQTGVAQASGEAIVSIPTGVAGFAPTLDVTAGLQVSAMSDFPIPNHVTAQVSTSSSASFEVIGADSATGFFEGGIHIAAPGLETGDAISVLNLSANIQLPGGSIGITATKNLGAGASGEFDISITRTGETPLYFTSPNLNEFIFFSSPVATGDVVSMAASSWGLVEAENGQGQRFPTITVFGWGAELPGDTDEDGDVDGDDLSNFEGGFGMSGSAALSMGSSPTLLDGDMNADGDVDGADFLVWQRYFGSTSPAAGTAAVPEPSTSLLSLLAAVVCTLSRPLRKKSSSVVGCVL